MSGTHEKMRAILLSFVMVTSIAVAGVAFSGGAAATGNNVAQGKSVQDLGTIQFTESSDGFGSSGTGVLSVSGASINQTASGLGFSTQSGSISNLRIDNGKVKFSYSGLNTSGLSDDTITLFGLVVDVPADASTVSVNGNIGTESGLSDTSTIETISETERVDGVRESTI
jgi:surface glycoprotein (TIGR04207 family)